jgi:hypothetical protein
MRAVPGIAGETLSRGIVNVAASPARLPRTIEFFPEEEIPRRRTQKCLRDRPERRKDSVENALGHPVTVGVMNRVIEVADREAACRAVSAVLAHGPLLEIVAQALGVKHRR